MAVAIQRNANSVPDIGVRTDEIASENLSSLVDIDVPGGRQHSIQALLKINYRRSIQGLAAVNYPVRETKIIFRSDNVEVSAVLVPLVAEPNDLDTLRSRIS